MAKTTTTTDVPDVAALLAKLDETLATIALALDPQGPAVTAPTKVRRNAAGRLVDDKGRYVATPKGEATTKAPKAPKAKTATIPVGIKAKGGMAQRSHKALRDAGVVVSAKASKAAIKKAADAKGVKIRFVKATEL